MKVFERTVNPMRFKPYTTLWKRKMEFILANKKRTAIPLIWLLIYLSIVPMQLSNYVLCIGTDGHVEFEVAINGRCADTQFKPSPFYLKR